jgi:pyridoxamine 5'-phosphate oxidase
MEPVDVSALREEFASIPLDAADLDPDPIAAFRQWLDAAVRSGAPEPNAMVLATADRDGVPSARTVLLRGLDDRGFVFFTSHVGRKAAELAANPQAALAFRWWQPQRQVTVAGPAARIDDGESDAYWSSRPRGSQVGAWASQQSTVIPDRAFLERSAAEVEVRFEGRELPRPPFWGGYRVTPLRIEFWQGRANRLHDRIRYQRASAGAPWIVERLSP